MNLTIRDQDGPGNAITRNIGHETFQRAVEIGAIGAWITFHQAYFEARVRLKFSGQRRIGCGGSCLARAKFHAFGPVEDHRGN